MSATSTLGERLKQSIMGNAARIHNTLNELTESRQNSNGARNGANTTHSDDTCTACGVQFHPLFKRKRECAACKEMHCSACLIRQQSDSGISAVPRCCNRCRVFSNPNLSWEDLMQLRARDLRWFLNRRRISTAGLKEKEQLAEIILEHCGSDSYQRRRASNQRHVAEMYVTMEGLLRGGETGQDENQEVQGTPAVPPAVPPAVSPPPYTDGETAQETETAAPSTAATRVTLQEINSLEEIEELSVKQLKDLLAYNFVDYKGCVEKHELLTRVKRLWNSHKDNEAKMDVEREEADSEDKDSKLTKGQDLDEDTDLCKICMDAQVDCVLLECGHMVTCVRCGKRMHECPICREYVVRAVRIFKA